MNKKNLDKYIIDFNASINDTIIAMDKTSFRTLVVEKNKKIGVVTEGDLLRSFRMDIVQIIVYLKLLNMILNMLTKIISIKLKKSLKII